MSVPEDDDEIFSIVLDVGSGSCKAGFAGDDEPKAEIGTLIGRPKSEFKCKSLNLEDTYVGEAAQKMRGLLSLNYPVQHGVVTDWDDMETIWQHIFENELKTSSNLENYPVLMTETPHNPKGNRETMAQVIFEKFNTAAFYVAPYPQLASYASGRGTGMCLEIGEGTCSIMPIYEGRAITHATDRMDFAGRDLTNFLSQILIEKGYSFSTSTLHEIVRDMKEKLCYCAMDYEAESSAMNSQSKLEQTYQVPDGQFITVDKERIKCPEALFKPSLMGLTDPGVHQMVMNSMEKCELDTRKDLFCNIIISGGSTLFPGFADRMQKEISNMAAPTVKVKIVSHAERKYHVWIGGSILASLSTFQDWWITQKDYEEHGPSFVHERCI